MADLRVPVQPGETAEPMPSEKILRAFVCNVLAYALAIGLVDTAMYVFRRLFLQVR